MAQTLSLEDRAIAAESVQHLQALLRIDTTNPPGNESAAARYIADVLSDEGYDPVVVESSTGRGNVVARYTGSGQNPPLLLYGHTDVVPADVEHWTHGPFSGDIAQGCVWGRGALDMKSLVAQDLMVMLLLRRRGVRLSRDVIFAATADEEAGGAAGMGFLVDLYPHLVRAEFGLSEGGGTTMYLAGRPLYDVRTAEKGTYRFRMRARGEPGHASIPPSETAISRLADAVAALTRTPLPYQSTPTFEAFLAVLSDMLGLPRLRQRPVREVHLARIIDAIPRGLADYLRAICHDTAVVTGLAAGKKINVIPGVAEAWVDGRYLPGQTEEGFLDEIRAVIGSGIELEPVSRSRPLEDPPGGPLYETIEHVLRRHEPRARITPMMLSGATDAKHVSRLGTKCIGFGPLRIDPAFPADGLVHGHNERVPIDGYIWGLHVLYDIVTTFCR